MMNADNPKFATHYHNVQGIVTTWDLFNQLVFAIIIFKLKAVILYMREEDDTVEKVERKLERFDCYKIAFGICLALSSLENFLGLGWSGIGMRYAQNDTEVLIWLVWKYTSELIQIVIMLELASIGLQLQAILRDYESIQGYTGDVMVIIALFCYFVYELQFLLVPYYIYQIVQDDDYSCSKTVQIIFVALQYFKALLIPFIFQLLFFALKHQLMQIQQAGRTLDNSSDQQSRYSQLDVDGIDT